MDIKNYAKYAIWRFSFILFRGMKFDVIWFDCRPSALLHPLNQFLNVPARINHSSMESTLEILSWFVASSKRKQISISKFTETLFTGRNFEFLVEPESKVVLYEPVATNDSLLFRWQVGTVIQWYSLKWAENCTQMPRPMQYQYLVTVVNLAGQMNEHVVVLYEYSNNNNNML